MDSRTYKVKQVKIIKMPKETKTSTVVMVHVLYCKYVTEQYILQ